MAGRRPQDGLGAALTTRVEGIPARPVALILGHPRTSAGSFDEDAHPRDDHGRFGPGGGGSSSDEEFTYESGQGTLKGALVEADDAGMLDYTSIEETTNWSESSPGSSGNYTVPDAETELLDKLSDWKEGITSKKIGDAIMTDLDVMDKPKFNGYVYRGMEHLPDGPEPEVGSVVDFGRPVCTSLDPKIASNFGGKVLMRIKVSNAYNIAHLGGSKHEKEVLARGASYEVIGSARHKDLWLLDLRQM